MEGGSDIERSRERKKERKEMSEKWKEINTNVNRYKR
jgi:hypothetical protein